MSSHRNAAAWRRRAGVTGALLTVLAALGLAWAFGGDLRRRPPDVLVIVIDSLRTDRVGAYGSRRRLTPFLDELAERATVYEQAYAASSWTVPSVASIFTGRYPSEHQAVTLLAPLQESELTVAEVLSAHGYATAAITANATIRAAGGFAQGFARYDAVGTATPGTPKFDGTLVTEQALQWLDEIGSERPRFLYLHYMDVHAPYRDHEGITPPRSATLQRGDAALNFAVSAGTWEGDAARRRSIWGFSADEIWRLEDLYDGEVRHQDALLRQLFDELDRRGFLDHALVVVTADHGEQFGRHGAYNHGTSLYDTLIHVPLIVRYPDQQAARRGAPPVELAGLGAMIIRVAGLPPAPSFHVREPSDHAIDGQPATTFSELRSSELYKVRTHKRALIVQSKKVVLTGDDRYLSYDLATDPLERNPQPASQELRDALAARIARTQSGDRGIAVEIDAATRERLRATGYLPDGP